MALLFMDSFDHYATADLADKWTSLSAVSGSNTIGAFGRRGSGGYRCVQSAFTGGASGCYVQKGLAPTGAGFVVGVACKPSAAPGSAAVTFLTIQEGATVQVALRLNQDLTLSALRGGTAVATSASPLSTATMSYVEFRGLIDPSVGTLDVRVNGVGVLTFSGNTRQTANSAWTALALGCNPAGIVGGALTLDFDDLYVCDRSGSAPWNDFLGDCRVDARLPTAAGATTGWTPLAGANWDAVNDAAPDDDTTYTSTSTLNATDTFVTQDAPVVGATIFGVQQCLNLKKMDAGTCTVAPVIRHSGIDYPGAAIAPGTTYAYGLAVAATNPGTGAAWTEADFNAAEFGYKRTA